MFTSAASMSMWRIRALGQNWDTIPVARSSKRTPAASTRSDSYMAVLAVMEPCIPTMPHHCWSASSMQPMPMRLDTTAMGTSASSSAMAAATWEELQPPPA